MAVKIYDSSVGAFKDAPTPQIYDASEQAYKDSVGLVRNESAQAWEERWSGNNDELVIFENGQFKNLPDSWENCYAKPGTAKTTVSITNNLATFDGNGYAYSSIIQNKPIDISGFTKLYVDIVEIKNLYGPTYATGTLMFDKNREMIYWLSYPLGVGEHEILFTEFENYNAEYLKNAYIGFYINYACMTFKKISFRK